MNTVKTIASLLAAMTLMLGASNTYAAACSPFTGNAGSTSMSQPNPNDSSAWFDELSKNG